MRALEVPVEDMVLIRGDNHAGMNNLKVEACR
jgi:hypothetical protein